MCGGHIFRHMSQHRGSSSVLRLNHKGRTAKASGNERQVAKRVSVALVYTATVPPNADVFSAWMSRLDGILRCTQKTQENRQFLRYSSILYCNL